MTTQLKNEIFCSKEHYLAFRKAWKDYINSGKAKPEYFKNAYGNMEKDDSPLTNAHQLLFAILTGRLKSAFRLPQVNTDKRGLAEAANRLNYIIRLAEKIVKFEETGEKPSYISDYETHIERDKMRLDEWLEPFGNGITPRMLRKLAPKGYIPVNELYDEVKRCE